MCSGRSELVIFACPIAWIARPYADQREQILVEGRRQFASAGSAGAQLVELLDIQLQILLKIFLQSRQPECAAQGQRPS